jgi:hypothetical protein
VLGEHGATITGRFYRTTGVTHGELVAAVEAAPDDAAVAAWAALCESATACHHITRARGHGKRPTSIASPNEKKR